MPQTDELLSRGRLALRAMDPSIAPSSDCSMFLQLPPELRNRIYEFALTTPHPLLNQVDKFRGSCFVLAKDPDREWNQLKYVSRQLRYETRGLELKFNGISFEQQDIKTAMFQFIDFVHRCSPRYLNQIRHVYISKPLSQYHVPGSPLDGNLLRMIHRVINFCRIHPQTRVDLRLLPRVDTIVELCLAVVYALFIKAAFRGVAWLGPMNHFISETTKALRCCRSFDASNVSNCRFLMAQRTFDQEDRALLLQDLRLLRSVNGGSLRQIIEAHGGVEAMAREIIGWHENGI